MQFHVPTLVLAAATLGLGLSPQGESPAQQRSARAVAAESPFHAGFEHALLQRSVGTWDAVVVTKDARGVEQRTNGVLKTEKHADFHTLDSFEGELLGQKLVGRGINGYCTVRRQYFTFWTDSMTSSPLTVYGEYDAGKRELSSNGECFGSSGKLEPCRTVARFQDDDHYTWTLYGRGSDGNEFQHLRIEYTRKR